MKKIFIVFLGLSLFCSLTFISCKKEDESKLSESEQKEIILSIFNAGNNALGKSRETQSSVKQEVKRTLINNIITAQYPFNNDFEYDYPDGKGGNIHMIVDTGGYMTYDDNTYQCLGAFLMINVTEQINNFRIELTNGRERYIDTDPNVIFSGNFYLQPGCTTFDSTKSNFRMQGTFRCNGIGYEMLLTGNINTDGTCHHIGGIINGLSVNYDF